MVVLLYYDQPVDFQIDDVSVLKCIYE